MIDPTENDVVWNRIVDIIVPISQALQNIAFSQFKLRAQLITLDENNKAPRTSIETLQKNLASIKSKIDAFKSDYTKIMKEIGDIKEQYPSESTVLITDAAYENMEILRDYLNNKPPNYDKLQQEIASLHEAQIQDKKPHLDGGEALDIT